MKKITSILLAMVMLFTLMACSNEPENNKFGENDAIKALKKLDTTPESDFSIEKVEGGIKIVAYNGTAESVVFPEKINGESVVEIGSYFFSNESQVKAVLIPNTVKKLSETFAHNTVIETVVCEGVEEIGPGAFYGCKNLKNVELSNKLDKIFEMAFHSCESLETLIFNSDPSQITGGSLIFGNCPKLTLYVKENSAMHMFVKDYSLKFELFE